MRFDRISPTWKKVISYVAVALAASALTFVICLSRPPQVNYTSTGVISNSQDKLNEIRKIIKDRYIGDVTDEELIEAAAAAMLEATGDQWSYYMNKDEYKLYTEDTKNAYEGVGVTVNANKYNGGFLIEEVERDSGAALAGINVGDVITHVNGVSTDEMTLDEARTNIRGKKGTTVELTLNRNGEPLVLLVSRGPVAVFVAGGELLDNNIGLVTIANFDDRCKIEVVKTIEDLIAQGAEALIFDVRFNPGGYKSELVDLLNYLLPEGVLFTSETYDGERTEDTSDAQCLEMPMAVLVNDKSYSAAEFFAAALEEYGWAKTIGEHTTGKGYFQTNFTLSDGSAVHLSVGKYFTPKGVSLAEVGGIAPSITVDIDEDIKEEIRKGTVEPADDPQIQAAVDYLLEKLN